MSPENAADLNAKPWLSLYGDLPLTIEPSFPDMLTLYRAAVARWPDRVAVRYFDRAITFAELDVLSARMATVMSTRGVRAGDRVAIILQNIPQFPVATIACWKIGAAPMPCNPMYSERELTVMFDDARPRLVICQTELQGVSLAAARAVGLGEEAVLATSAATWQGRGDPRVLPETTVDPLGEALASAVALDEGRAPAPASAGLLMYTSGTTGRPKGAVLSHAALTFNTEASRVWFGLGDGAAMLCMAPLFHITGFVCNFCAALAVGGAMVISYRFHPAVMLEALVEHRPSFAIGAITALMALANAPSVEAETFASLTQVYSGGAPISPVLADAFQALTGKVLLPAYGMTETAAPAHVGPPGVATPTDPASGAWSIGVPISGVDVRLVDETGRDVAPGQQGEMWLRGRQIMTEYWRRPEDTAATLTDGWLRTGDVAVMDDKGWFYLVDRKKDVIIASGFKVWPREVEEVLYGHPAVREAAVVGVPDSYRGETVKAYLSLAPGTQLEPGEVEAYCRDRLAAYKVPRLIEILDDLPKTASGKITRAALRPAAPDVMEAPR